MCFLTPAHLGAKHQRTELPMVSAYRAGCLCPRRSGPPPDTLGSPSHRSGTGVWRRQHLQFDEMQFNSPEPFPAGIVLMETASETTPLAPLKSLIACKTSSLLCLPPNRPPHAAAPPQHPPISIQVQAGGK